MITLTINGIPYNYPEPGEDPAWGQDATGWAQAVTEALSTLVSEGDILDSVFTVQNNINVFSNINGLFFDPASIRSAEITYNIYRVSSTTASGKAETGTILIVYDDSAAADNKWLMSQTSVGTAGVALSINDTGQFQYISSDIGSTDYSGTINFRAKVFTNS